MMTDLIEEEALSRSDRRRIGALLAAEWGPEWRARAHAGPHAPVFRAVERNRRGYPIGHVSAFALTTAPVRAVWGIGDLVVKARYRGRGISLDVSRTAVDECIRRGADVILVDTLAARSAFAGLGFRPVERFDYFYVRDGACVRHPHWMALELTEPCRLEILEHGDF